MATVTFLEPGTDATQDFTFWQGGTDATGTGATLTSATDQAHTGSRSIKSFLGSATSSDAIAWTGNGFLADAGTCLSMWVRFAGLPTVTKTAFLQLSDNGFNNNIIDLGLTTTGTIACGSEGVGLLGTGTAVVVAATWTRVSVSYTITDTTHYAIKIYVNGVLDQSLTQTAGTLVHVGTSVIVVGGCPDSSAGFPGSDANFTVWLDDIYVDNRSDLTDCGDVRVTAKRPFANGTTNGFSTQVGAGGSGYGTGHAPQVNEQPLSQTNGWSMVGAGSAITEEYNIEPAGTGDVDVTARSLPGFIGWVFAKSLAGETGSIIVDGASSSIALTSTATAFFKASNAGTYPKGTGTDIGIVTDTSLTTVSLYECGVLVAYAPGLLPGFLSKQGPSQLVRL